MPGGDERPVKDAHDEKDERERDAQQVVRSREPFAFLYFILFRTKKKHKSLVSNDYLMFHAFIHSLRSRGYDDEEV